MTALEYLGVVLMLPIAGLIIGALMLFVVNRDAQKEDRRDRMPAE